MSDESTVCPKCHVELEFVRDQAYAHGFGDGLEKDAAERDAMRLVVEAAQAYVTFAETPAANTRRDPEWQDERLRLWAGLVMAVDSLPDAEEATKP